MKLILTLYLFFIARGVFPSEPIVLPENLKEFPIGLYLDILEDKEGNLTMDEIQNPALESRWEKSQKEVPSYGYSKSAYWVRFTLDAKSDREYYLEIDYPLMDKIDFYQISPSGKMLHKQSGDMFPFENRAINYRNFIFFVTTSKNVPNQYYLRFKSEGSLIIPLILYDPVSFAEKKNIEMMTLGFFFGALIIMAFYNLFLWISVRDKSYILYVFFILANCLATANVLGVTYQFFGVFSPYFYNQSFSSLSIFLNVFVGILFTSNYLQINRNLPLYYKIYKGICFISILGFFISPFFSYRLGSVFGVLLVVFSNLWMFSAGIITAIKSYRPAKFYLLGWSAFLIFNIVGIFPFLGLIPKNFFTTYSGMIGNIFQVILLSFGLADRINELQKQNESSQLKILETERKANKVKDEFLANLSHELKTPLTTVFVLSEILANNKKYPEEVVEYSREIRAGAGKLNEYVNDLILVTDIESNLELQKSKVILHTLISENLKELESLRQEKCVQIIFEPKESIELYCDSLLLPKAILAIVKNAIVYNKHQGKIIISLHSGIQKINDISINGVEISISDDGMGIASDLQKKIFEKFFRVDTSLSYEVSGVGLGLFIAKKIIELHKGSIDVKSELGKGSEFIIRLPFANE